MLDNMKTLGFGWAGLLEGFGKPLPGHFCFMSTRRPERVSRWGLMTLREASTQHFPSEGHFRAAKDMSVPAKKAPLCDGSQQRQLQAEVDKRCVTRRGYQYARQAKYRNGEITVVEKFLNVTEEWTRTSEEVKNEAVSNFRDPGRHFCSSGCANQWRSWLAPVTRTMIPTIQSGAKLNQAGW